MAARVLRAIGDSYLLDAAVVAADLEEITSDTLPRADRVIGALRAIADRYESEVRALRTTRNGEPIAAMDVPTFATAEQMDRVIELLGELQAVVLREVIEVRSEAAEQVVAGVVKREMNLRARGDQRDEAPLGPVEDEGLDISGADDLLYEQVRGSGRRGVAVDRHAVDGDGGHGISCAVVSPGAVTPAAPEATVQAVGASPVADARAGAVEPHTPAPARGRAA